MLLCENVFLKLIIKKKDEDVNPVLGREIFVFIFLIWN
jgi:hypothetical protein